MMPFKFSKGVSMNTNLYVGARRDGRALVKVDDEHGTRMLDPRNDLMNHSPNGFEWGYGGSGPAQLALAILADALQDDERALRLHQRFKDRMIAPIDGDEFTMTAARVRHVVLEIEKEMSDEHEAVRVRGAASPGPDEGREGAGREAEE